MADQQQLKQIERGVDAWNKWRMENRHIIEVDLKNAELAKNTLSNSRFA